MQSSIDNIDLKNKTISGVIWKFLERISAQLITFIVSIILARIIAPEDYGIIALVTVFITLANVFVINGLGTSLVQKKNVDNKDFSTMFYASIILSLILYAILFFVAPLISKIYKNNLLTPVLRVMGLRIPIAAINSIQNAYVSNKMIYKKFFFATLIGTVISAFVGIIMAYNGLGVWALIGQYLTNTLIDTIVLFLTLDWKPKLYFSIKRFKKLFSYGWKIMLSSFIGTFFDQLNGLFIGIKYKSVDLAYYNRGEQFPALITNNVNSTIESVLFPVASKLQDDKEKLKNSISKMMKVICFVATPALMGLAVISKNLIKIVLTDKWLYSIPYLQIFCFRAIFVILSTVNLQTIKGIGRSDTVLKLEIVKKPIYLLVLLISMRISPLFIAIGSLFYSIIAFLLNAFPNRKYLNYSIKNQIWDVLPIFIISAIMAICVYLLGFLNINKFILLSLQVICGICIYLILALLFKIDSLKLLISIIKEKIKLRKKNNNF